MINEGSVTVAEDGGVLITIFPAGLTSGVETLVSVRGARVRIGQGKTALVDFAMPEGGEWAIEAIKATADITVVEVGEAGWIEHTKIKKV
jgi:hypothetical protein